MSLQMLRFVRQACCKYGKNSPYSYVGYHLFTAGETKVRHLQDGSCKVRCKLSYSGKKFKQQVKKPVFIEVSSLASWSISLGKASQRVPKIAALKQQNTQFELYVVKPANVSVAIAISNMSSN
ncbi:MAG: hypothetical protein ACRC62_08760 [Microcoleus sp.]